ncbi:TPA: restriction endonuclease subunit S [Streptococcus suis]
MPNKDRNIPKRRFKEFENEDAWELRKLGEVVYRSNITSSSKVLPRLEFEDINSGLGTLNKDIFQKVNDDRKGLEFNEGDVLFGKLRPYLKNWWYAEFNGIALGDFWNLKSDVWHSCFLYTYIQSNAFQLVANDTSGTKMPRSDWNLVAESIAKFPTLPEQSAIGTFFSTLDQQITLHQRKLDKLKHVKQAYLSEMFPAEGERVPKRRFPGFTDAWELRKLGELAEIVRGASPRPIQDPKWFDEQSEIGWLRISDVTEQDGRIYHLEQKISKLGQQKTRVLVEPHLLLSIAATVGKPVVNYVKTGVHDGFLIFLEPRFEQEFMFQWLEMFRSSWSKYGQPGSQVNLNSDLVKNQELSIPTHPEQEAIGTFFSTLDQQITLHQRKLEKLKNLKKALLNELFV